ncbi:MAG: DNA gyrase inhibitor YacG, partial [Gammaproteobacteria bacterium]
SDRCRLIDLGDWLMERNALPAEDGSPSDQEPSGN